MNFSKILSTELSISYTSYLQVLSLEQNQLWDYPVWSLTSLPSLARLSVGQNAWPCDCLTVRNIQQLSLLSILTDNNVACTTLSGKSPWARDKEEGKIVINFTFKEEKTLTFSTTHSGRGGSEVYTLYPRQTC